MTDLALTDAATRPVYSMTADQDWAPPWAAREFLERLDRLDVPAHVFRTNRCPVLDAAAAGGRITTGWHPNFLPGSTHGDDPGQVVRWMRDRFPGARSARGHGNAEHTDALLALRRAGIVVDSQFATRFQPGLAPLVHWHGMVRFPVYFEDDVFLELAGPDLSLDALDDGLLSPGLKILDFHPIHVALNTPSLDYYVSRKGRIYGGDGAGEGLAHEGRGVAVVLDEIVESVRAAGHEFVSFEDLVDAAVAAHPALDGS